MSIPSPSPSMIDIALSSISTVDNLSFVLWDEFKFRRKLGLRSVMGDVIELGGDRGEFDRSLQSCCEVLLMMKY
eukprot:CAMPEP_0113639416 /NCGR_PEP_ID=MMETSP0017_2-20120614/20675_1 /TAXON_ID=2856 /ORGANISM="Cylindrotheca closterium" /LENGTH=73 /DNA_ID=CAMNT_0000550623 /DNA_START=200 /DNA_END=421 /DNA_ORIENTATION=- /assembly_acc=CAM_ASM_000147